MSEPRSKPHAGASAGPHEGAVEGRRTRAGTGLSSNADGAAAAREALATALEGGGAPPRLVIAYATVSHDQEAVLRAIGEELPGVPVAGASSAGVSVLGVATEAPRCVAVAVLRSDTVVARVASVQDILSDPSGKGRELARRLGPAPADPSVTLLWYDPLTGANIAALIDGIIAGGYPCFTGGGAGQPYGPRVRTFQYDGDRVLTGGAVAVTLEGLRAVHDLTQGTEPTGLELTVTGASDNVIEQIDGQPALDVCCEQLGFEGVEVQSSNWAIGLKPPEGTAYEGLFTRGIFGVDTERRTITLQTPVAVGTRIHICIRTKAAVLDRAAAMGRRLGEALSGERPVLSLSFECAARPPFLGTRVAEQEVKDIQALLGSDVPWLGMLAWGEIAPLAGQATFHNHTFPLCVLCE